MTDPLGSSWAVTLGGQTISCGDTRLRRRNDGGHTLKPVRRSHTSSNFESFHCVRQVWPSSDVGAEKPKPTIRPSRTASSDYARCPLRSRLSNLCTWLTASAQPIIPVVLDVLPIEPLRPAITRPPLRQSTRRGVAFRFRVLPLVRRQRERPKSRHRIRSQPPNLLWCETMSHDHPQVSHKSYSSCRGAGWPLIRCEVHATLTYAVTLSLSSLGCPMRPPSTSGKAIKHPGPLAPHFSASSRGESSWGSRVVEGVECEGGLGLRTRRAWFHASWAS